MSHWSFRKKYRLNEQEDYLYICPVQAKGCKERHGPLITGPRELEFKPCKVCEPKHRPHQIIATREAHK